MDTGCVRKEAVGFPGVWQHSSKVKDYMHTCKYILFTKAGENDLTIIIFISFQYNNSKQCQNTNNISYLPIYINTLWDLSFDNTTIERRLAGIDFSSQDKDNFLKAS